MLSPRRRTWWTRRRLLVVGVLGWIAWAGADVALAAGDLRAARTSSVAAQGMVKGDTKALSAASDALRSAAGRFESAHAHLSDTELWPLRFVPVVGRQLVAVKTLAVAGSDATATTADALDAAGEDVRAVPRDGLGRIQILRRVVGAATVAQHRMSQIDLGPDHGLIQPVGAARVLIGRQLLRARTALDNAVRGLNASLGLLEGQHRVLLVVANNAEMRAGSGIAGQAGVLSTDNGKLTLESMRPVDDLQLPAGAVPVPQALFARWGNFSLTQDLRELFLAPRFDVTAPLAAQMWAQLQGGSVDAVMLIDPVLLQAVLRVTGPVPAGGQTYDAGTVIPELLHNQYVRNGSENTQRQAALGDLARAVFETLSGGGAPLGRLGDALASSAAGRHVMVWSQDPESERAWTQIGVGGGLSADSVLVALVNRGANKLDYFVPMKGDVEVHPVAGGSAVQVHIHMQNDTPPGEPTYVAGPNPGGVGANEYNGILQVSVPGRAVDVAFDGLGSPEIDGVDGPTWVIATPVLLHPGEAKDITLRFRIPRMPTLRIEPAARKPGIVWRIDGSAAPGDHAHVIALR